jgi:catechol 2,3-dioxygenase-like lactoylglutathione lyase family enzyme
MLDHLGISISDLARSRAFYLTALAPLGMDIQLEVSAEQTGDHAAIGFGANGKPFFWIGEGKQPASSIHVAFAAGSRADVDAFHCAALTAGGRDNGAPGLRPHFHADYYGAYVLDPDGYNVEAVCHAPEA